MATSSLESKAKTNQLYEKIKNKNYSRKIEITPRDCTRFREGFKGISIEQAMMYLKLRREGCNRKDAIVFGGKAFCRVDTTKELDGPPSFRILKISSKPKIATHNGWLCQLPEFDLGPEFRTRSKEYNLEEAKNEALLQKLVELEDEHKKKFKDNINSLRKYYLEYLEQTHFKGLPKIELYQKSVLFRQRLNQLKLNQQAKIREDPDSELQIDEKNKYMHSDETEELKQLIRLYDNLAVYSDYLMKLTQDQQGIPRSEHLKEEDDRMKKFIHKASGAGLTLIKKSNDIKDEFNEAAYFFYKAEKPESSQKVPVPQESSSVPFQVTELVSVDLADNVVLPYQTVDNTASLFQNYTQKNIPDEQTVIEEIKNKPVSSFEKWKVFKEVQKQKQDPSFYLSRNGSSFRSGRQRTRNLESDSTKYSSFRLKKATNSQNAKKLSNLDSISSFRNSNTNKEGYGIKKKIKKKLIIPLLEPFFPDPKAYKKIPVLQTQASEEKPKTSFGRWRQMHLSSQNNSSKNIARPTNN